MILESETGGLLILDATNLLSTVLLKDDSVLLARNLKSYIQRKSDKDQHWGAKSYPNDKVKVKVLAP